MFESTLLKVTLLHECFSSFSNCTNDTTQCITHIVRYKKTPYVYLKFKAYEIFKEKSPCNRK